MHIDATEEGFIKKVKLNNDCIEDKLTWPSCSVQNYLGSRTSLARTLISPRELMSMKLNFA